MINPAPACRRVPPGRRNRRPSNRNIHTRVAIQQHREENLILREQLRSVDDLVLTSRIPRRAARPTRRIRINPIPRDDLLLVDSGRRPILIRINDIRQQRPPAIMREPIRVIKRGTARGEKAIIISPQRPNVVGLAEVVPRDDLDEVGRERGDLFPAVVPQVVAAPEPVLRPPGQVGEEPGADGHHVGAFAG